MLELWVRVRVRVRLGYETPGYTKRLAYEMSGSPVADRRSFFQSQTITAIWPVPKVFGLI